MTSSEPPYSRRPTSQPHPLVLLGRALTIRCVVCGGGGLFHHWFKIKDRCPSCGFVFGRGESGYQLGSMALDLIIPITSCILLIALSIFLTWPNPPWQLIQWGSIAYIVSVPLLFYPMSHTLAMFLDVLVRPPDLPLDTDQSAGK